MKPSSSHNRGRKNCRSGARRLFPITDSNYQAFSLHHHYGGRSENSGASFLNISREYFRSEARRYFLAEAAFFLVFVVILALTFIFGAIVVIQALNLADA
jgi:hypothetical protein